MSKICALIYRNLPCPQKFLATRLCKLPKLVTKEFDGNVLNRQTFWDQFESTIHSKININNIDKFSYLKSFWCPSAYETISGLALTNQNHLEPRVIETTMRYLYGAFCKVR